MPYLTPERFRNMGMGIDLSNTSDSALRATIAGASALVDTYCAVPLLPQRHDFRGGVITGEQHRWLLPPSVFELGSRRFYPWHYPVQSIQQFRIYVTNTQYVQIAPDEIYLQNSEGYAEVVSLALTGVGLFNALIIPNVGLATPTGVMNYTYGYQFGTNGEELDPVDALTYSAENGWWDPTVPPVVYINGSVLGSGYTVNYNEGELTFSAPLASNDVVTVDYTYRLPPAIGQATAILTAQSLGESDLRSKGMTSLSSIHIEELELRRSFGHAGVSSIAQISDSAKVMLEPFIFVTAGGGA